MSIVDEVRAALLKRGSHSIKGFSRTFRIYDDDGSKSLNYEEFSEGVKDYGLDWSNEKIKELFQSTDKDGSGSINFNEFLLQLRGSLNETRLGLVKQAFKKADKTGDGVVTAADLKRVYKVSDHPKYKNGEWDEKQVFDEFLKTFENSDQADGKVTEREFIDYYSSVSASIDDDNYFGLMIRNAWKL